MTPPMTAPSAPVASPPDQSLASAAVPQSPVQQQQQQHLWQAQQMWHNYLLQQQMQAQAQAQAQQQQQLPQAQTAQMMPLSPQFAPYSPLQQMQQMPMQAFAVEGQAFTPPQMSEPVEHQLWIPPPAAQSPAARSNPLLRRSPTSLSGSSNDSSLDRNSPAASPAAAPEPAKSAEHSHKPQSASASSSQSTSVSAQQSPRLNPAAATFSPSQQTTAAPVAPVEVPPLQIVNLPGSASATSSSSSAQSPGSSGRTALTVLKESSRKAHRRGTRHRHSELSSGGSPKQQGSPQQGAQQEPQQQVKFWQSCSELTRCFFAGSAS